MNESEQTLFTLGREALNRGDINSALKSLNKVLKSCPGYADVHYWLGLAYEQKGNLFAATQSLEKALELNPAYAEALSALACVYEQQGDFQKARVLANRAQNVTNTTSNGLDRTTRGKLANLQAGLGDAYKEVGELKEAAAAYRKALDRCPEFHDIRIQLAEVLREIGLPDQSIQQLQRVLQQQPGSEAAAIQLGLTYYTLGKIELAVQEWENVATINPKNRDAEMYLRMVLKLEIDQEYAQAGQSQVEPQTEPSQIEPNFEFVVQN